MATKKQSKKQGAVDVVEETRKKEAVRGLFFMLLGAVIAGMAGVFLYLSPFLNKEKPQPALNEPVKVEPINTEEKPKDEYVFYEVLPKQDFQSTPDGASMQDKPKQTDELPVDKVVKTAPEEMVVVEDENETYDDASDVGDVSIDAPPKTTYILQVRSYENSDEADQKRAEVLMAGVDADIIKRDVNGTVLYQVVSTAFDTEEEAVFAYNRLQSSGIDAVVVERTHSP